VSARLGKYISNEHSLDVFEDEYGLVNENLLRWVRRLRRMSMGMGEDKEEALEAHLMVRRVMMVLIMDESLIPDVYHLPCSLHSSIISSTNFLQDVLSESSLNSTIAHSALPSSVEHCRRYNHKYNSYQASGAKQLHRSNNNKKKKIIFQQYDVDNFSLPYYHAYIEHFHDSYDVCRYDTNDDNDDDVDGDDDDENDCDDGSDDDDNNNNNHDSDDGEDDGNDDDGVVIMMMMIVIMMIVIMIMFLMMMMMITMMMIMIMLMMNDDDDDDDSDEW
jgi:hypothetical protein